MQINLTENINRSVVRWPEYNPWAIELAMNSRGLTIKELAIQTGISNISELVDGKTEATHQQIQVIGRILCYPNAFFKEYYKTKISWCDNGLSYNIPIRYCDYPIFMILKNTQ
jgi:hypothetical protein